MNKTVKKLDNNVVKALTNVCEYAKGSIVGFKWITHTADYSNFPHSLIITCVFDTKDSKNLAEQNGDFVLLTRNIHNALLKVGIVLKQAKRNVQFDSEEAGAEARLLLKKH